MTELDEIRRELERRQSGEPERAICPVHGPHEGVVCIRCYALQQQRVERESLPLRTANTASALRERVLAELAFRNGH